MKHVDSQLSTLKRCLGLTVLSLVASLAVQAQTPAEPYYSKFAAPASPAQYSVRRDGALCVNCGVTDPGRAADLDMSNYATVQNTLGVGTRTALRLALTGAASVGYRAGVVIGNGTTLDAAALDAIVLRTYQGTALQETHLASASAVAASTLTDGRTRLEFVSEKPLDHVEVELLGTASALNTVQVYYAYAVPSNFSTVAAGYLSRLTTPSSDDFLSSSGGAAFCSATQVRNADKAVTPDLNDYATLSTNVGLGCNARLQVRLEGTAPAGYQAGFVIGNGSIVDLDVLKQLKITTYLGNIPQETVSAADLLQLNLMPNGRYEVSFASTKAFDRVELVQSSLANVVSNLNVYYGFGIEPRAFGDDDPVLSDFSAPQITTDYQAGGGALVCVNCSLENPERAADNVMSVTDFARMNFPVTALGTQRIKLRLNGPGEAGNEAGVVLKTNTGLLSTALLANATIRTYSGPDGNTLVETATGSSLLQSGLLSGDRQEIGFLTTQDFEWVEIELQGGVGLFEKADIFYGFAQDPASGFPLEVRPPRTPLPVELVAFGAKAQGNAVLLSWQTASERNSSRFVVERATSAAGPYEAIGQLQAAGNSTSRRAYSLRDTEAAQVRATTLYYRLRQVDNDGATAYSRVAPVQWLVGQATALEIYPNPAVGSAAVRFGEVQWPANASLHVYGSHGAMVRRQALQGNDEQMLNGLKPGVYQVVLQDGNGQRIASQRLSVVAP